MSEIPTTTTTTTIPCADKYTVVTLAEGESYVLPPGAVLVGASDPSLLTSLNDCLDLTGVETPECYGFYFHESVANPNPGFGDTVLEGIQINNVRYPFSSSIVVTNAAYFCDDCVPTALVNAFSNAVLSTSIGNVFTDITGYSDDWNQPVFPSNPDRANIFVLCWKTIPSLAAEAYVYGYGTSNGPDINVLWPITKPSDMPLDPRMYANCPCA